MNKVYGLVGQICLFLACASLAFSNARAQSGYTVTERGADYKVWQKTVVENGTNRVHKYTEMATGMHYTNDAGQLTESREQITLLPSGGAAATQGRTKVSFPADIYNGVLTVTTPDGRTLQSRPLGITYDDGSNTVFIAMLTNSVGYLVGSNKVVFRNAFSGVSADLVCTFRRSGFESDVVFREQPPTPESYGLDPSFTTLQMVTEFFNTQDPQQIPAGYDEWLGLQDSTLKFGRLTMTHGKAFAIGATNTAPRTLDTKRQIPVYKRWLKLDGRKFLIEEVPLEYLADDLNVLPLTASTGAHTPVASPQILMASNRRHFPASHGFVADTNQILLASVDLTKEPGVVLDYTTVGGSTEQMRFVEGTYLITGDVWLTDYGSFAGGSVIKFDDTYVMPSLTIDCPMEYWDGAVFTIRGDDSVGEIIPGSWGSGSFAGHSPRIYARGLAIYGHDGETINMNRYEFRFLSTALEVDCNVNIYFYETKFRDCATALDLYNNSDCFVYANSGEISVCGTDVLVNNNNGANVGLGDIGAVDCDDLDGNGLPDWWERLYFGHLGVDPNGDANESGVSNLQEYQNGTIPTNRDANNDGLPDWWQYHWFGNLNHHDSELDASGRTLSSDYLSYSNHIATNDPNVIAFSIEATNDYVNTTAANVQLNISIGEPAYYAVFVNTTATTNWLPFAGTNLTVTLSGTDGVYNIMVGLKGIAPEATQTWESYSVTLDRVAPNLVVTNPVLAIAAGTATATVIKPYLQIMGNADEPLCSLSYDINNAAGSLTDQDALVSDQYFDTNKFDFTTNYFQAYDVPLTNGANAITLRVTDRAGNVATTNFTVTLDYSGAVDPVVTLIWPQNGMAVSGDHCTIRGTMSDETGTIQATVVNGDGTTTTIPGLIERNNMFWIENVPLNGVNTITLQATDASGTKTVTSTFTVNPSDIQLTIDSTPTGEELYNSTGTVGGTVSDANAIVTVNGVGADVNAEANGAGTYDWIANAVPVYGAATATFNADAKLPGHSVPSASAGTQIEKPAKVVVASYFSYISGHARMGGYAWFDVWNKYYSSFLISGPSALYPWYQYYSGTGSGLYGDELDITGTSTVWSWSNLDPDGAMVLTDDYGNETTYTSVGGDGLLTLDRSYTDSPGGYIYHYYADRRHYHNDYAAGPENGPRWIDVTVSARTKTVLYTGGKSGVNRLNLFQIRPSAQAYSEPKLPLDIDSFTWAGVKTTEALPKDLRVLGKTPGDDYNLWVALPDGSNPVDITVHACGRKHYNANVTQQKYNIQITHQCKATTPSNRDRTTVGVGELVDVSIVGLPPEINVTWALDNYSGSKGTLSERSGTSTVWTAPNYASGGSQTIVLKALFRASGDIYSYTIPFTVLNPTGIKMKLLSGEHPPLSTTIGMHIQAYLLPDTVNFSHCKTREEDKDLFGNPIMIYGYGCYAGSNQHGTSVAVSYLDDVEPGFGTKCAVSPTDHVLFYGAQTGEGEARCDIPCDWTCNDSGWNLNEFQAVQTAKSVLNPETSEYKLTVEKNDAKFECDR